MNKSLIGVFVGGGASVIIALGSTFIPPAGANGTPTTKLSTMELRVQQDVNNVCRGYSSARPCEEIVRRMALAHVPDDLSDRGPTLQPYVLTIMYDANFRTDSPSVFSTQEFTSAPRCLDRLEVVKKALGLRTTQILTCSPK